MRTRTLLSVLALVWAANVAVGRSSVVTFSRPELVSLLASTCNLQVQPRGAIHVNRNTAGNMVYIIAEGECETIVFAQSQSCNRLSSDTLNIWRRDGDGSVAGQLANRFGSRRLLAGTDSEGIRGNRHDLDRTGQFVLASQGQASSLTSVDKPYRPLLTLTLDGQRVFARRGGLLIIGNNTASGQLEAVDVALNAGAAQASAPRPVAGMPAGVRVLDYNEATDELLLGGLDATGNTSFVVVNMASGQAVPVSSAKPGDEYALFVSDGGVRARLGGGGGNVSSSAPSTQAPGGSPDQPKKKFGLFKLFNRKSE